MSDTFWLGYQVFRLGLWPTRHSLPWSVSLPPSFAYQSVFPAPERAFTINSNVTGADHFSKCGEGYRSRGSSSFLTGSRPWRRWNFWGLKYILTSSILTIDIEKTILGVRQIWPILFTQNVPARWLPGREQFAHGAGGISRRGASLRRCEWWELSWKPEPSRQPPPPPADWPPSLEDVPNITITPTDYWHSMETIANYSGRIWIGLSWHMSLLRIPLRTSSIFPGNKMS